MSRTDTREIFLSIQLTPILWAKNAIDPLIDTITKVQHKHLITRMIQSSATKMLFLKQKNGVKQINGKYSYFPMGCLSGIKRYHK